jgi:hypothetical protein
MTMRRFLFMFCFLLILSFGLLGQTHQEETIINKYEDSLQKIIDLQKKIDRLHPFLKKLYPVVILEEGSFYLFDIESSPKRYEFVKSAPSSFEAPQGLRAAFPLDFYDNQTACVVTGDVFDDLAGYVMIFHEFIHCAQAKNGEQELKSGLGIARAAMEEEYVMWELEHPFPYEDVQFVDIYSVFLEKAAEDDAEGVARCRAFLKETLNTHDYEYLVWQEWKEGLARMIENRIRKKLDLELNLGGLEKPFHRVTFYQGGAFYIDILISQDKELEDDIKALFQRMLDGVRP